MEIINSHRLAARMPDSRSGDASSSLAESICPNCKTSVLPSDVVTTEGLPVSPGNFTVCPECYTILQFNSQLNLHLLTEQGWLNLLRDQEMFLAVFKWRLELIKDELKHAGYTADGLSGIG